MFRKMPQIIAAMLYFQQQSSFALVRLFLVGDIQDGRHPAGHLAMLLPIGCIRHERGGGEAPISYLAFVLDSMTFENPFDVRQDRSERFLADDLGDGLSNHIFRAPPSWRRAVR